MWELQTLMIEAVTANLGRGGDIDEALEAVEAAGGRRLTDRMPIPTVGWSALFEDTEGNHVGIFQEDPEVPMPTGDG